MLSVSAAAPAGVSPGQSLFCGDIMMTVCGPVGQQGETDLGQSGLAWVWNLVGEVHLKEEKVCKLYTL